MGTDLSEAFLATVEIVFNGWSLMGWLLTY